MERLQEALDKWPQALANLKHHLESAQTTTPSLQECKEKWALTKRLLASKLAEGPPPQREETTKASENENENELDALLAEASEDKKGDERENYTKDVERLKRAKTLAGNLLLSCVLLSYKEGLGEMEGEMKSETERLSKVSKVVKGLTERYVRQRTMLGMQLEQMVLMLEESVKEEKIQLVRATCRSIGTLVESVNVSLRESCKSADLAILNLVNYMKNMVLVGLPLVDSSLFSSNHMGGSSPMNNQKPIPLLGMKSSNTGASNQATILAGHEDGTALGLKRVFEEVKVFVKECETLQSILQRHEAESWKSMFATIPASLSNSSLE
jgi:hypothetical protein